MGRYEGGVPMVGSYPCEEEEDRGPLSTGEDRRRPPAGQNEALHQKQTVGPSNPANPKNQEEAPA